MKILLSITLMLLSFARMAAAFNAPDFSFSHYTTENGLPSNNVRDIVQDDEGYMWFATDGGLVRFDGSSSKVFLGGLLFSEVIQRKSGSGGGDWEERREGGCG